MNCAWLMRRRAVMALMVLSSRGLSLNVRAFHPASSASRGMASGLVLIFFLVVFLVFMLLRYAHHVALVNT